MDREGWEGEGRMGREWKGGRGSVKREGELDLYFCPGDRRVASYS